MSFEGKTVFITGASSGIGAQLAVELVSRGARVGLVARREERLRDLVAKLPDGRSAWAVADVTDRAATAAACDQLVREFDDRAGSGVPDVVVANAGINRPETMEKYQPGRALSIYETNLLGFLYILDWALPRFLERDAGHLVGIASVASYFGFAHNAAYCGSKAAMRFHLQSLRQSLRHSNIAVTTICPGFVESELTQKNQFTMPFLWPTERAARRIADAIGQRRAEDVFPWQMRWLVAVGIARVLPRRLAERLLAGAG